MKKAADWYVEKWWRPVIILVLAIIVFGMVFVIRNQILEWITGLSLLLAFAGLCTSVVVQFVRKKWMEGFFSLFLLAAIVVGLVFFSVMLFWIDQSTPDQWADDLEIPADIPMNRPIDLIDEGKRPDSLVDRVSTQTDFQLYNSFQPGIYEYDVWVGKTEPGIIYLKAFEITGNTPLSASRLPESSAVAIHNPEDTIIRFGTTKTFTIYEGDWDKPYAARFEVWFKPDRGLEYKLFSKNYIIEGWMR